MRTVNVNRTDRGNSPAGERAFTLIELLITLGIMAVAILPMLLSYTKTWQATIEAERRTRASMLARQKIEILRGTGNFSSLTGETGNFKPPYNTYGYETAVETIEGNDPNFEAKQLKIKVKFTSIYGNRRTISCPEKTACPEFDYSKIITRYKP